MRLEANVII